MPNGEVSKHKATKTERGRKARRTLVVHDGALVDEEAMGLSSQRLQEGGTTRPGRTEYDQHLSGFDQTFEIFEDLDLAALVAHQLLDQTLAFQPHISDALLVIRVTAKAMDIEVAEGNTCGPWRGGVGVL